MQIRHNLPLLMAKYRIKSVKELTRLMEKKYGYEYATLYNFYTYVHKKIDPKLLADLCEFFDCEPKDILYLEREKEGVFR